jgi:hypothetical protein
MGKRVISHFLSLQRPFNKKTANLTAMELQKHIKYKERKKND